MTREELMVLADELESMDAREGCRTCPADGTKDCRGDLSCEEAIARAASRRIREIAEHAADDVTTVSAYDLLPDEDRKAIAWVREHGGTDAVEKRLMPEGMEWPRYTDGSHVEIGDEVVGPDYGERISVDAVKFHANGFTLYDKNGFDKWYESDDRFERPDPKVVDADVVEIKKGDTVWDKYGAAFDVVDVHPMSNTFDAIRVCDKERVIGLYGTRFTHEQPVLAADGEPLKAGETVWDVESYIEYEVVCIHADEDTPVRVMRTDGSHLAKAAKPSTLTHEQPDTWERLEADARMEAFDYVAQRKPEVGEDTSISEDKCIDLVRRARKLAGVS